nr:MAG TPA: hypothetical protein [Bacteriophage sp.]
MQFIPSARWLISIPKAPPVRPSKSHKAMRIWLYCSGGTSCV